MVWIIIVGVLLVAFGPVLYLLPTKKDRRLAALRQHARLLGFVVELQPIRKLNPDARDRVTAGGQLRTPQHSSVAYTLGLRSRFEHLQPWRLLKGAGTTAPLEGWVLDQDAFENSDLDYLQAFQPLFAGLPSDTVAVALGRRTLTCYWLEKYPADAATVDALHSVMVELGERLAVREEQIADEIRDRNS